MKSILVVVMMLLVTNLWAQSLPTHPMGSTLEWVIEVDEDLALNGYKIYYGLDGSPIDQEIVLSDALAVRAAEQGDMIEGEELYEYSLIQSPFQIGSQYCFQVTGYLNTAVVGAIRESTKSDVVCGLVVPTLRRVIRVRLTK